MTISLQWLANANNSFIMQTEYGLYLASVALKEEQLRYCLIQVMEPVTGLDGEFITNDLECPLLTLSKSICAVHPICVLSSISVVHQCTGSCIFVERLSSANVERESISRKVLVYEHDWSMICIV